MTVSSLLAACGAACALALTPVAQAAAAPAAAPAVSASAAAAPLTPMQALLATVPPPKLDARAWIVVDLTSGQILAEHNAHQQEAPASLTKLMTAYLTFKALKEGTIKLDQMVTESTEAWKTGGSRMFIDPRVPVSVNDLLLGMIVQSATTRR